VEPTASQPWLPMQACEGPMVNRTVVDYAFEGAYRFVYMIPQDAQLGCPARPQAEQEPEAYPLGRTVRRIRSTKSVRAAELVRRPGPR